MKKTINIGRVEFNVDGAIAQETMDKLEKRVMRVIRRIHSLSTKSGEAGRFSWEARERYVDRTTGLPQWRTEMYGRNAYDPSWEGHRIVVEAESIYEISFEDDSYYSHGEPMKEVTFEDLEDALGLAE